MTQRLQYRRLHAPREDGSALVEPPFDQVGPAVSRNLRHRSRFHYDVQGRSLAQLSQQARRELLDEARRWTAAYRDVTPASTDPAGPIFLAGHQPELFHPGVWFKNFALGRVAQQHGAAAVNLVIDSDTLKTPTLRVPGGDAANPQIEAVPFDRPGPRIAYEERSILDCPLFLDFGRRAAARIGPLVADPLLRRYWPMVAARSQHTHNLGECFAQSRHQLEGQWGLQTLEIPQSKVCDSEAFLWFVVHLLAQLTHFHEIYNQAVHEYRRTHRIRNAAHPVPDLAAEAPWLEAPLWVWSTDDPQRRRVYAHASGRETILSDRSGLEIRLALGPDSDGARAVEQLVDWGRRGVKIRSRALITTLWARLVLGDLFLHGIGGAKYDQVTDALVERFFGLQPPEIMVLSATLHLPIERPGATDDELRAIRDQLRELSWHPEKFLAGQVSALAPLLDAKRRWIETVPTPQIAHERWRELRRINEALQPGLADRRQQLLDRRATVTRAVRAESVLTSREYGSCLYPETTLQNFLGTLLPKNR
jgi:hypothetical protein